MKTIIVKTQVEIDDLPEKFNEFTFIEIRASQRITVYKARENSSVEAWGNSSVVARGNSSVEARENSRVVAWGNSRVVARENSSVEAWENSSVVARENVGVHLQSDFASVILFMYSECGEGKFHACSRPYFCDEFRNNNGDKYIAIEIKKDDLYAWPNPVYPHKIAFREGKVLYECDKFGKEKKP